jgi:nucleotide-binding universal stress UspA family protein
MSTDADVARPHIVVGVDGSSESVRATAWAAEQARATGGTLELLIVWARPMSYGLPLVVGGYNPEEEAQGVVDKAASGIDLPAQRLRWSSARRARTSSSWDRAGTAGLRRCCSGQ